MAFVQKVSCASLTVLNDKSRLVKQCVGITQSFSTSANKRDAKSYKLVIAGGGCGGTAAANMFAKKLGRGQVAIIEPKDVSRLYNYENKQQFYYYVRKLLQFSLPGLKIWQKKLMNVSICIL